jgi:hypothetical protein
MQAVAGEPDSGVAGEAGARRMKCSGRNSTGLYWAQSPMTPESDPFLLARRACILDVDFPVSSQGKSCIVGTPVRPESTRGFGL